MIRTDRYKFIKRYPGPNGHFPDELYDLADDPDEEHNRYPDPACAGTVADLTARLEAQFAYHEDPARSGLRVADLPRQTTRSPGGSSRSTASATNRPTERCYLPRLPEQRC